MARFSILSLLFVILGSAYGNQPFDESCEFRAHLKCWNLSTEEAFKNLGSVPDDAFLKENCDAIIEQLDCLVEEEKLSDCPSLTMFLGPTKKKIRGLLGLKHLMDDLCEEDSSLRKGYIQTIGCLVEHDNEFDEKMSEIGRILRIFNNHLENEEIRVAAETLQCVEFSFFVNEMKNSVEDHCGPVALKTVDTILNYVVIMEPDHCLEDQENIERLIELLQSIKSSRENVLQ